MPKSTVDWTEAKTETLKRMWMAGAPASEIIGALGRDVTPGSLNGKAHRLGLPKRRGAVIAENAKVICKRKGFQNRPISAAAVAAAAKVERIYDNRQPGDVARIFGAENLKSFQCRWPIGDPHQPGFGYCGEACKEIFGYCEAHAKRAFNPNALKPVRYDKRLA
jgi:GcrA cell cycle regulator